MSRKFAFDATARTIDTDGRLHIEKSHISKACVNPYYGREIPKSELLGLDPNRIYQLLRAPEELARAAESFARIPILSKHQPINAADHPHELVVGSVGSDVVFNDPYLDADTCYWDNVAIAGIETEQKREHSAAYRYDADMTPGMYQGVAYDGVMRNIVGNHLALVESGRAGPDVLAADEKPTETKPMSKRGKARVVTLGALSPKIAQDASLPSLVESVTKANRNAVKVKLIAMDADLEAEKLEAVLEALMDDEPAEDADLDDETEEEKKKRLAAEKKAEDAEPEPKPKAKGDDKKAMDAAIATVTASLRAADEARRAVRPVVGEVIAQDSAEDIYGFALDHLQISRAGVTELAGLKALYTVATKPAAPPARVAMDSAGLAARFPNANRFKQA